MSRFIVYSGAPAPGRARRRPIAPLRVCRFSVNVSFGRQAFGRRCELHFVRAARDDALARLHTALDADEIAVTARDLEEPPRKSLAAHLNEDVRPSRFHEHRGFRHGWE